MRGEGTQALVAAAQRLRAAVRRLRFDPPTAYVYSPLDYAWRPHREYLRRYGAPPKAVLLVGMNPGPFGMVQTGIPFGDVAMVREWLGVEAPVGKPPREHPRRPVEGFACRRREVSGRRFWGWARARCGSPARFFRRFFVYNYCPLTFLERSGRNRTPDRLPAPERAQLFPLCDRALRRVATVLRVEAVVGIGNFAAARATAALAGLDLPVARLLHPSPASPAANRNWDEEADRVLGPWLHGQQLMR